MCFVEIDTVGAVDAVCEDDQTHLSHRGYDLNLIGSLPVTSFSYRNSKKEAYLIITLWCKRPGDFSCLEVLARRLCLLEGRFTTHSYQKVRTLSFSPFVNNTSTLKPSCFFILTLWSSDFFVFNRVLYL